MYFIVKECVCLYVRVSVCIVQCFYLRDLVENHNGSILQQTTSNGYPLLLSSTQLESWETGSDEAIPAAQWALTSLPDRRLQSLRKSRDESVQLCEASYFLEYRDLVPLLAIFFVGSSAVVDVIPQSVVEERHVLRNHSNAVPV